MAAQEFGKAQNETISSDVQSVPLAPSHKEFQPKFEKTLPLSPLQAFLKWEQERPQDTFLVQPFSSGEIFSYSWQRVGQEARAMAAYIQSLDLAPGSRIAIQSKNCAHWIMADLAIWMSGHVSVPLFPTASSDCLKHVFEHSEARLLFVGKVDDWNQSSGILEPGIPIVAFPYQEIANAKQWTELVREHQPIQQIEERHPDDVATIIYTSGTTGLPKGVMHSFRSMSAAVYRANEIFKFAEPQTMFSYLPLSHVVERMFVEIGSLYFGFQVFFFGSTRTFFEDLRRASPSIFFGVPQVWLAIQREIKDNLIANQMEWCLGLPIISTWIKHRMLKKIGLQNVVYCVGGAAPVSVSLMDWYQKIGIHIMEAYGMTENMGYSHCTRKGDVAFGSVGHCNPGVEVKIDTNGEVLVKSASNMIGYYKDPELTSDSLTEEGFLRTGDLGELDDQGRLYITGRIKDIFKTAEGKYICPIQIEHLLLDEPYVAQVCVTGGGLRSPIALITLSEQALLELKHDRGRRAITEILSLLLEKINRRLEVYERLSHIVILKETWLPENNKLTPSFKLKRNVIEAANKKYFEQWSHSQEPVIWLF